MNFNANFNAERAGHWTCTHAFKVYSLQINFQKKNITVQPKDYSKQKMKTKKQKPQNKTRPKQNNK